MGGQALLEMFSEIIRDAEKKALNSFCTASTPLLYVPLTQPEAVHCAQTLNTKTELGSWL